MIFPKLTKNKIVKKKIMLTFLILKAAVCYITNNLRLNVSNQSLVSKPSYPLMKHFFEFLRSLKNESKHILFYILLFTIY